MNETTVTVPIQLDGPAEQQAQPEPQSGFKNGVYVPPAQRVGPHQTRMGVVLAKHVEQSESTAPVWIDNPRGGGGRFEYRPVQRAEPIPTAASQVAQPSDAVSQQLGVLTNTVKLLAQRQLGIEPDTGPKMPNPEAFNFYDEQETALYHKMLQDYTEAVWQQRKQAELEPYLPAMDDAVRRHETDTQFKQLTAKHGDNPHFKQVMAAALQLVADSHNTISLNDAFVKANSRDNKPGERGGHLPQALTRGKLPRLGQILAHNQLTGRSGRR